MDSPARCRPAAAGVGIRAGPACRLFAGGRGRLPKQTGVALARPRGSGWRREAAAGGAPSVVGLGPGRDRNRFRVELWAGLAGTVTVGHEQH